MDIKQWLKAVILLVVVVSISLLSLLTLKYLLKSKISSAYSESTLNSEQVKLKTKYLQENTPTIATLSDRRIRYYFIDNTLNTTEDFRIDNYGKPILTPEQKKKIVNTRIVNAPDWLFWKNEVTVREHNKLTSRLIFLPGLIIFTIALLMTALSADRFQDQSLALTVIGVAIFLSNLEGDKLSAVLSTILITTLSTMTLAPFLKKK